MRISPFLIMMNVVVTFWHLLVNPRDYYPLNKISVAARIRDFPGFAATPNFSLEGSAKNSIPRLESFAKPSVFLLSFHQYVNAKGVCICKVIGLCRRR